MKIERTRNATRNVVFGALLKIYQIAIPFLIRTAMIYFMGIKYLGLNSLFTSILQVLNLAELGVGSAMVFSMYRPIAKDETGTICALLRLYRFYYRIIGAIIATAGILLTPFIPALIKSDFPAELNIYVIYWLNLFATVLSYWLFAYKNSLFQAHQRNDVPNKVSLLTSTVQYVLQLIVIIFIKDYYIYLILTLAAQAATNILTALLATKMYPDYQPKGKLPRTMIKEINHRIRDLFTAKIGAVIVNSADTVVISAFLGLTILAIYQNYYFILTAIIGIVSVIFTGCTAGIGNSIITESKEKNFKDLKKLTFLIAWLAGFCTCCLLCLYQPFMRIWVGEELMLDFSAVICFCIYYFIYEINQLLNTFKDAAGMWHEDRFRPLVTAGANLCMNLIMVQFWGIYGVLLSTVLSMLFIGMPWILYNLFTVLFEKEKLKSYIKQLVYYTLITSIICGITYYLCTFSNFGKWWELILRAIICCIVPNLLYWIIYHNLPEFKESLLLVNEITKGKLSFLVKKEEYNN